jgi:pyruvate kinase
VFLSEKLIKIFKEKGLAVIMYSQLLESLLTKKKPTISEICDIMAYVRLGIDGFKLGLETINHNSCDHAINTLADLLADYQEYIPKYHKSDTRS